MRIRRLLTQETCWKHIFETENGTTGNIAKFGDEYLLNINNNCKNLFWKDVLSSWLTIYKTNTPNNISDLVRTPLWRNSNLKIGNVSINYKNYIDAHITHIYDLLEDDMTFKSHVQIKENVGNNAIFLNYASLCESINQYAARFKIKLHDCQQKLKITACPFIPFHINILLNEQKGCKSMYKILTKQNTSINHPSQLKWATQLSLVETNWNSIFTTTFKSVLDPKIKWMQYSIIYRILPTNSYLTKIKIKTSNTCDTCKSCPETIEHLFWECVHSNVMWNNLKQWINDSTKTKISFTLNSVLLGIQKQKYNQAMNSIIMYTKYYIYRCKKLKKIPNFILLQKFLTENYKMEKYIAYRDQNVPKFLEKWGIYNRLFEPSITIHTD